MSTSTTVGIHHSGPSSPTVLPLLSTSLTVFYAICETSIFTSFLSVDHSIPAKLASTNRVIRQWWTAFLRPGGGIIVALGLSSLAAGIYASRSFPAESQARLLCTWGTGLAMAHFLFGPSVAGIIQNLCDEEVEKKGGTRNELKRWLRLHAWRTSLTDLPALACFAWVVFMM